MVDPPEHAAHRGVGATALELAADGSEARARALLAKANVELLGAPEDVLEEAARLADSLGQPGAPLVRARGANADRLRPAALPGGGSLERSTARTASRDRRSGSSVRGLRGGLARGCRRLPLRRCAAFGRASRRSLAASLTASPRPFRLPRARAGGRARRLAGAGCADGSCVGSDRGESRDAVCAESPRPAPLQPRAPLPGRRGTGRGARAGRLASRGRGLRDVSERRAAPDRSRARRPPRAESLVELPVERALVWGPGSSLRGSTPSSPSADTT